MDVEYFNYEGAPRREKTLGQPGSVSNFETHTCQQLNFFHYLGNFTYKQMITFQFCWFLQNTQNLHEASLSTRLKFNLKIENGKRNFKM